MFFEELNLNMDTEIFPFIRKGYEKEVEEIQKERLTLNSTIL